MDIKISVEVTDDELAAALVQFFAKKTIYNTKTWKVIRANTKGKEIINEVVSALEPELVPAVEKPAKVVSVIAPVVTLPIDQMIKELNIGDGVALAIKRRVRMNKIVVDERLLKFLRGKQKQIEAGDVNVMNEYPALTP